LYGVSVSNRSFLSRKKRRSVEKIFLAERIDTVIMNLPSDLKLAAPAARKAGVRHVIYRRGSAIPIRNSWLNRRLFGRYLTGMIANSEETKRTILARNSTLFDPDRIRVIYNGLDLAEWDGIADSRLYQGQPGQFVVGNAGRLTRQKGQESLIAIARDLKEKGLDFIVLIAGEGPLRTRLEEQASRAGVDDRVVFTGFVRNMKSFMDSLDLFVLTSRWEGFGYVLIEAMAASRPVIAFDNSSNPEIIADGVTGILAGDVEEMASRILELSGRGEEREMMGRAGRKRVETMFTLGGSAARLEEYLLELEGNKT
ncbi:MAG TPA: glycosyltransferase family 4 protein, partial [Candidatus Krumholzibacterium sp.]|nr:glycosyltransferase family 4 protein [Candidatus Krumholzibacterium sp.]